MITLKNGLLTGTLAFAALFAGCTPKGAPQLTLKDALKDKFYIGVAVNKAQTIGQDTAGIRIMEQQFNSIVAENCMKSVHIHPEENRYNFALPDQFVALGEKHNMFIVGHALIWHSQSAPWFYIDEKGNNVSPEVLKQRMKDHIYTIVGRYKGRVNGWDVVNEAFLDNGEMRDNKFYEILGDEYIELAFQYAHEADPEVELYYNDYNEWYVGRREAIVRMIRKFKEKGIRIDGIGLQGHIGMEYPTLEEYEKCILAYTNEGVKTMVTELELSILPTPNGNVGAEISTNFEYKEEMNPYKEGVPAEKMEEWTNRFGDFFGLFLKHHDKITRVTMWGITDGDSWKNNFPIHGRTDYPLLFDRNHQAKPIVQNIIEKAVKAK